MMRRSRFVAKLREHVAHNLEAAEISQKLGEARREAFHRGLVAGYARTLSYVFEGSDNDQWLEATRVADAQSDYLYGLTKREENPQ